MPLPVTWTRHPSPRQLSFVRFLAQEILSKDLWVMIFSSALISVAYTLRSGARDRIYWRLRD